MKYLSKPPLFSEQNKNSQEKGQSESYKEFIEAQKTKAIERDQRYIFKARGNLEVGGSGTRWEYRVCLSYFYG